MGTPTHPTHLTTLTTPATAATAASRIDARSSVCPLRAAHAQFLRNCAPAAMAIAADVRPHRRARPLAAAALVLLASTASANPEPTDPDSTDPDGDAGSHIVPILPAWRSIDAASALGTQQPGRVLRVEADPGDFAADWTVVATRTLAAGPNPATVAQVRLRVASWDLPGDDRVDGAIVRVTSLTDGASQDLGGTGLRTWGGNLAFLNGGVFLVELLVRGPRHLWADAQVTLSTLDVLDAPTSPLLLGRSICGPIDDRVPDQDPIIARIWPSICTATMIQDFNAGMVTAGHCGPATGAVVQFNVPLSTSGGAAVSPPPEDQYPVDFASVQRLSGGTGQDWSYFGILPNSLGEAARTRQGLGATVAPAAPTLVGTPLRIAGFGTTSSPISPSWNVALKTNAGALTLIDGTRLRHTVDTTGGNSGSAIMLDAGPGGASRTIVGIHSHAGCSATGGSNVGTVIQHPGLQAALASPRGVCASGATALAPLSYEGLGDVWLGTDGANNIGAVRVTPDGLGSEPVGGLARRVVAPRAIQALATTGSGAVLAVSTGNEAFTIVPRTGEVASVGAVVDASGEAVAQITGLAVASDGRAFAVAQATSRVYELNTATGTLTSLGVVGAPGVTRIGALEWDPVAGVLLALDDVPGGSTRLLTIVPPPAGSNPPESIAWSVVGSLGAGATDCNGLARTPTGALFTVDVSTGRLLRIERATGGATFLANVQGTILGGYGMAWVERAALEPECVGDFDGDGGITAADIGAFFGVFESGSPNADLDGDGGITPSDVARFFEAFEVGC